MAQVSTYLNFSRNTEEAFKFYKAIFGGEFNGGIARFGDMPPSVRINMAWTGCLIVQKNKKSTF